MDSNIKKLLGIVVGLGALILIVIPLFAFSIIYKKNNNEQELNSGLNTSVTAIESGSLNLPKGCKVEDILLDSKVFIVKTNQDCPYFSIGTVSNSKVKINNIAK